jgi:serine carboxypeptidase-like clade 2
VQKEGRKLGEIPDCPSDNGAISYWNLNKYAYKTDKVNKTWQVCTGINYEISERGSMQEYRNIFLNGGVKVWLFSGDWDDVVPYPDTEKNVDQFHRPKAGEWSPWNVGEHHAGFYQIYDKLTVITVKGAGHMVPVTKPKQAYQLFYNFVNNKGVNNQVF